MRSRIFTRFLHILRFTPCVYSDFKLTHHKTVSHFRKKMTPIQWAGNKNDNFNFSTYLTEYLKK